MNEPHVATATGNPISVNTDMRAPLKSCNVGIEPVQDLHGQDSPYPPGGGKNKLGGTTRRWNSANCTYGQLLQGTTPNGELVVPAGTYTVSASAEMAGIYVIGSDGTSLKTVYNNTKATFTISEEQAIGIKFYKANAGEDYWGTLTYQLESGSTATDYAPYSNICPITGWTGADVTRTGKNLLPSMTDGTYTGKGITAVVKDGVATLSGTSTSSGNAFTIPLVESFTFTQSMRDKGLYYHPNNTAAMPSLAPTLESLDETSFTAPALSPANRSPGRIVQSNVGKKVDQIRFYVGASGMTCSGTYSPAFVYSSSAASYEKYKGIVNVPISWQTEAGVVYGGTVDPVNGKLIVSMGYRRLASTSIASYESGYTARTTAAGGKPTVYLRNLFNTYNARQRKSGGIKALCNMFPIIYNSTAVSSSQNRCCFIVDGVNINSVETFTNAVADAESKGNDLYIAFELENPTVIDLTPTEISTLLGANNIWSNTNGDIQIQYWKH